MRHIERRSSWRNDLMGDDRTVSAERRGDQGVLAICDHVKSVESLRMYSKNGLCVLSLTTSDSGPLSPRRHTGARA